MHEKVCENHDLCMWLGQPHAKIAIFACGCLHGRHAKKFQNKKIISQKRITLAALGGVRSGAPSLQPRGSRRCSLPSLPASTIVRLAARSRQDKARTAGSRRRRPTATLPPPCALGSRPSAADRSRHRPAEEAAARSGQEAHPSLPPTTGVLGSRHVSDRPATGSGREGAERRRAGASSHRCSGIGWRMEPVASRRRVVGGGGVRDGGGAATHLPDPPLAVTVAAATPDPRAADMVFPRAAPLDPPPGLLLAADARSRRGRGRVKGQKKMRERIERERERGESKIEG